VTSIGPCAKSYRIGREKKSYIFAPDADHGGTRAAGDDLGHPCAASRCSHTRADSAGTPLRQDRIAAQFGVSHILVREALQQLAAEGLAVLIHNRGYVVSELSPEVVWELTEYRERLSG
jgi:biotin operon repressor